MLMDVRLPHGEEVVGLGCVVAHEVVADLAVCFPSALVLLLFDECLLFQLLLSQLSHQLGFFGDVVDDAVLVVFKVKLALRVRVFVPDLDAPVLHVEVHFAEDLVPVPLGPQVSFGVEDDGVKMFS